MEKMRKMCVSVLPILLLLSLATAIMGCLSCNRATNAASDLRNCKEVPAVIADAKLLSYTYSLHSTMRWPLHSENVQLCADDSSRCIIRLFDDARVNPDNFDRNGDPLPDSLVVSSEVLDRIKQMIVDAKAWRFKDDYSPKVRTLDGYSWAYSATFSVTDSMLAATPEVQRRRLLRHGGRILSSGGCNASPDTDLFEQIRSYLNDIYESKKINRDLFNHYASH